MTPAGRGSRQRSALPRPGRAACRLVANKAHPANRTVRAVHEHKWSNFLCVFLHSFRETCALLVSGVPYSQIVKQCRFIPH